MINEYTIQRMNNDELNESHAMDFVWKVFLEFEAPEYSDEVSENFRSLLHHMLWNTA